MKSIKFDHELAQRIQDARKNTTWRIYDDQHLSVDDRVELIDKVNDADPTTWQPFAEAVIDRIYEKRLGDVTQNDFDVNHTYESQEQMLEHYRDFYGPEVNLQTPIKMITFSLASPINSDNVDKKSSTSTLLTEAKLYGDGGSRGNPGPSASGFVILNMDGEIVVQKGIYLGITTNNQAEYRSLRFGMEEALKLGIKSLHVYMDSLLVINQMLGKFKVKNRDLWPIHEDVKKLAQKFQKVSYQHIPRELNKIADGEVNKALDDQASKHSL